MSVDAIYGDDELAALYDLSFAEYDEDVAMHEAFARRGDTPALELGAGTGRLALRLARAGIDVVALDSAPAMLRRLRASLDEQLEKRVRIVEADMRSFALDARYDTIHIAANTFQHLLTSDDQAATLRCVAAHLAPAGLCIAKLASVSSVDWGAADGDLRLRQTLVDPGTGETIMRFDAARPNANDLILERTFIYDRIRADGAVARRTARTALRYMPPAEVALLLRGAGLRLTQLYGSYDLSPFTEDSDTMIFVAEHATT